MDRPGMDLDAAHRTIQRMGARDLRRAYRSTFTIKALEPVRGLIAHRLQSMGLKLPKVEAFNPAKAA